MCAKIRQSANGHSRRSLFFFFQAEDGIRDLTVTGVQTCALPILATPLKNQRGYIIEVQGFSSGRGTAAIQTSQKMADSVVRYLVLNHEIPVYRKIGRASCRERV